MKTITYKDYFTSINDSIVIENKREELYETYINMFKIFEKMTTSTISETHHLVKKLEEIEFKMQELFGFQHNRDFHRYWLESPRCSCPKMDNYDNYGTPYRITDLDCPIHGEKITNIGKRLEKLKRILEES